MMQQKFDSSQYELIKETNNYFIFENITSGSKYKIYAPNFKIAIERLKDTIEKEY